MKLLLWVCLLSCRLNEIIGSWTTLYTEIESRSLSLSYLSTTKHEPIAKTTITWYVWSRSNFLCWFWHINSQEKNWPEARWTHFCCSIQVLLMYLPTVCVWYTWMQDVFKLVWQNPTVEDFIIWGHGLNIDHESPEDWIYALGQNINQREKTNYYWGKFRFIRFIVKRRKR